MKILFFLLVLFSQSSFATIYKCSSSSGVSYQDTPCQPSQTQQIFSSSTSPASLSDIAVRSDAFDFTDIKRSLYITFGILAGVALLMFGGSVVLPKLGLSKKQINRASSKRASSRVSWANKRQNDSFSADDYFSSVDDNYYSSQLDDYYR